MQHKEMAYLLQCEEWMLEEDEVIEALKAEGWHYTDEGGIGWYCVWVEAPVKHLARAYFQVSQINWSGNDDGDEIFRVDVPRNRGWGYAERVC